MQRAKGFWAWAAVACVGLQACTVAPGTPAVPPTGVPGTVSPGAPPAGPVVRRTLEATLRFPPGSLPALQRGLRIQRAVTAEELAAEELANLVITVGGQVLDKTTISVKLIEWESTGDLRTTIRAVDVPLHEGPVIFSVATPSRNLELRAVLLAQGPDQITIDVRSTAVALILEHLQQQGETVVAEDIDPRGVTLVANRLASAIASIGQRPLLADPAVTAAVEAAAAAQRNGTHPDAALNSGGGSGGGGGGGGASAPSVPTVPSFGALNFQSAPAPFGLPLVHEVVKAGNRLYATFNGLAHTSTDDGQTWTPLTNSPYGYCLVTDGTNVYGGGNTGIWYAPLSGGAFTYLGQPGVDGLPFTLIPQAILAADDKVWFCNRIDGKIYVRPLDQSQPWIQFGNGVSFNSSTSLATDGGHVFASIGGKVYALAMATPGGTWTELNGGSAPTAAKELRLIGTELHTVSGDKRYILPIGSLDLGGSLPAWSNETVQSGVTLSQLDDDGTDVWVAGTATVSGRTVGQVFRKPLDNSAAWSQEGANFRFPPEPEGEPGLLQVQNGSVLVGAQRLAGGSWSVLQPELANFLPSGNLVAAGGRIWLREDGDVWCRAGSGGAWTKLDAGLPANSYNTANRTLYAAGNQLFVVAQPNGTQLYSLDASLGLPDWSAFGDPLSATPSLLAADATHLYALAGSPAQVYRIPLSGGTWSTFGSPLTLGANQHRAMTVTGGTVYVATDNAVYQVDSNSNTPLGGTLALSISRLEILGNRLLCFGYPTDNKAVAREWDGTAWNPFAELPTVNTPLVTRAGTSLVLAVGGWGCYELPQGAATWTQLSNLPIYLADLVYEPTANKFVATSSESGIQETP